MRLLWLRALLEEGQLELLLLRWDWLLASKLVLDEILLQLSHKLQIIDAKLLVHASHLLAKERHLIKTKPKHWHSRYIKSTHEWHWLRATAMLSMTSVAGLFLLILLFFLLLVLLSVLIFLPSG